MLASSECALVLLAAGGSTRMGRPKQLLDLGGRTMLRHIVDATLAAPVAPFVVVLGSEAKVIRGSLSGAAVHVVANADWDEGIGSSIRAGIGAVRSLAPAASGVVIALGDQPGLDAGKIGKLLREQRRSRRKIAAAKVEGVLQPPVYFSSDYFEELLALKGDEGAKSLLKTHAEDVEAVSMAHLWDIDTGEDYSAFIARY
jgi:molybdenum cofactor cytidylyltransferase